MSNSLGPCPLKHHPDSKRRGRFGRKMPGNSGGPAEVRKPEKKTKCRCLANATLHACPKNPQGPSNGRVNEPVWRRGVFGSSK